MNYTYLVKNKITSEFYYGSRSGNVKLKRQAKDDFWIHYFTSSKEIKNLRKIYGDYSFDFIILKESENYNECYWHEQELIKENILDSLCLNKYYQDRETNSKKFSMSGCVVSNDIRKKMSLAKKGKLKSKEHKDKISGSKKGTIPWNKDKKTGRLSDNHRDNISNSLKGKPAHNKGITCTQEYKDRMSVIVTEHWKKRKEQKNVV